MKNFVGIDLGTTNSAICSYDGSETRIWKSPDQNDVTPSAIYIDRRGNKYLGNERMTLLHTAQIMQRYYSSDLWVQTPRFLFLQ